MLDDSRLWFSLPLFAKLHSRLRLTRLRARKLVRLLGDRTYWPALRNGVAASVEHASIPFGSGIRTVLDVGASRGQFALFAGSRFKGAKIISFEPLPEAMADLKRVLGHEVETHQTAVGSVSGHAWINVSGNDDSSSLLAIGPRQEVEFPGTAAVGSIEVPVTTLDEVLTDDLARPCLLKIDVQGLELEVLKGATKTLQSVDEALVECSFVELYEGQAMADEVVVHLRKAGLRLAGVYEVVHAADGTAIQADFLFRR